MIINAYDIKIQKFSKKFMSISYYFDLVDERNHSDKIEIKIVPSILKGQSKEEYTNYSKALLNQVHQLLLKYQ